MSDLEDEEELGGKLEESAGVQHGGMSTAMPTTTSSGSTAKPKRSTAVGWRV